MIDVQAVRKAVDECLNNLTYEPNVLMYLITKSRRKNEPFFIYKVEPEGKAPSHFRETLEKQLSEIQNTKQDRNIKDFFNPNRNQHDVLVIAAQRIAEFEWIRGIIDQHPLLRPPPKHFDEMDPMWGYAIQIGDLEKRVIYLHKYTNSKIVAETDKKGKWMGQLSSEGKIIDLKEKVLTLDQRIDGIYLDVIDSILVIPPHSFFETMFNLRDFYVKEYEKSIENLRNKSLIFVDIAVINSGRSQSRLVRRFTELSLDGFFKKMEEKEITTYFFEETKKQIGDKITYEIDGNHIRLLDVESMKSFIDVCAEKYVKSMAGYKKGVDPRIFMAEYKDLM